MERLCLLSDRIPRDQSLLLEIAIIAPAGFAGLVEGTAILA
jgi:hypothetical protein